MASASRLGKEFPSMSAVTFVQPASVPAPVRSIFRSVWAVTTQVRTAEQGDIDVFENLAQTGADWVDLDRTAGLDLSQVKTVWLSFGTVNDPNYQARLTGFDDATMRLAGPPVVKLQDELLRRVPRT
jgi:hypothetical protein